MGASQEEEGEDLVKRVEVRRMREYKVSWEPRKWRVSSTVDLMRSNQCISSPWDIAGLGPRGLYITTLHLPEVQGPGVIQTPRLAV